MGPDFDTEKRTRCLKTDQRGKSFVVAFPYTGSDDNTNLLFITSEIDVIVFLVIPGINDTKYTISSGSSERVYLPYETTVVSNMAVERKGIQVIASGPVSVYGYLNQYDSIGGFLALPVEALSTEYIAVSYLPYDNMGGQIVVVATEDDTKVEITLKISGSTLCNGQWIPDGETLSFQLQHLDVVRVFCEMDITGTYVKGTKPIAVLSGNPLSQVPHNVEFPDNLVEMLIPIYALGTMYSLAPITGRSSGALYRIVASQDNTNITVSSGKTYELSQRSFVELDLPQNAYTCIISNNPVLVVQFGKGESADAPNFEGDPFMAIMPPTDRFTSAYMLDLFTATSTPGNEIVPYITVFIDDIRKSELSLPPASFAVVPDCDLTSGFVLGSEGTNQMTHKDRAVFGAVVHGLVTWKGYGFMAGIALDDYSGKSECASTPCDNEGICYEVGFTYLCYCHGRYHGQHCEHDAVDDCQSMPCNNGGTCTDLVGRFDCRCSAPYTGETCSFTVTTEGMVTSDVSTQESLTPSVTVDDASEAFQSETSKPTDPGSTAANEVTTSIGGTTVLVTQTTTVKVTRNQSLKTSPCQCTCKNITYEEVKEKTKEIIKQLTVDPVVLSKSKRKFVSIEDNRLSAASIGCLGGAFLTLVFGCIFLIDLSTFISRRMQTSREGSRVHGLSCDVRIPQRHVVHMAS